MGFVNYSLWVLPCLGGSGLFLICTAVQIRLLSLYLLFVCISYSAFPPREGLLYGCLSYRAYRSTHKRRNRFFYRCLSAVSSVHLSTGSVSLPVGGQR